jgi:hypothetical protein
MGSFDSSVELELRDAVRYYDNKREHLGDEFLRGVRAAISKITHIPIAGPL